MKPDRRGREYEWIQSVRRAIRVPHIGRFMRLLNTSRWGVAEEKRGGLKVIKKLYYKCDIEKNHIFV